MELKTTKEERGLIRRWSEAKTVPTWNDQKICHILDDFSTLEAELMNNQAHIAHLQTEKTNLQNTLRMAKMVLKDIASVGGKFTPYRHVCLAENWLKQHPE